MRRSEGGRRICTIIDVDLLVVCFCVDLLLRASGSLLHLLHFGGQLYTYTPIGIPLHNSGILVILKT